MPPRLQRGAAPKGKASPKVRQKINQMLTDYLGPIENSPRRTSEMLKAGEIRVGKTTAPTVIEEAGYKVRRPQNKRAVTKTQGANRVELRGKILGALESAGVGLEDIWSPDETSLRANKLGRSRRNDAV